MNVGWAGVAFSMPNRLGLLPAVAGGEETADRDACVGAELSISMRLGCVAATGYEVGAA